MTGDSIMYSSPGCVQPKVKWNQVSYHCSYPYVTRANSWTLPTSPLWECRKSLIARLWHGPDHLLRNARCVQTSLVHLFIVCRYTTALTTCTVKGMRSIFLSHTPRRRLTSSLDLWEAF